MENKNITLYKNSKKYIKAVLNFIKETYRSKEFPQITVKRIEKDRGKSFTTHLETIPYYYGIIFGHQNELVNLKEYNEFKKALYGDKYIGQHLDKMIYISSQGRRFNLEECVNTFIFNILRKTENFNYNEEIFDEVFNAFVNSFTQEKFSFRAFAFLNNFASEFKKINIARNINIRNLNTNDFEKFGEDDILLPPFYERSIDLLSIDYLMEINYTETKYIKLPKDKIEFEKIPKKDTSKLFQDIISCIRLIKPSAIYYNAIYFEQINNIVFNFRYASSGNILIRRMFGKECYFGKDDVKELKELYRKYRTINFKKNKHLKLSIDRFNIAQERLRNEDKLIDYIICLEALLVKEDQRVYFKLPNLIANELLNYYPKQETIIAVKNAISLRNSILHARSLTRNIEDITKKIEEYSSIIIRDKIKSL